MEDSGVILQQFSPEEIEEIRQMKSQPQIYSKLINSIAPTVFGEFFFLLLFLLFLFRWDLKSIFHLDIRP